MPVTMVVRVIVPEIVMAMIVVIVVTCGVCQNHCYVIPQNESPEMGLMTPSSAAYR